VAEKGECFDQAGKVFVTAPDAGVEEKLFCDFVFFESFFGDRGVLDKGEFIADSVVNDFYFFFGNV